MRRRVWQGFLDWFRPGEHGVSTSQREIQSVGISRESGESGESGEMVAELALANEPVELELMEFLATDLDPVMADPTFKEELREQLWELVREGATGRSREH